MSDVRLPVNTWSTVKSWAVHFTPKIPEFAAENDVSKADLQLFSKSNSGGAGQVAIQKAVDGQPLNHSKAVEAGELCVEYAARNGLSFETADRDVISAAFLIVGVVEAQKVLEDAAKKIGVQGASLALALRSGLQERTIQGVLMRHRAPFTVCLRTLDAIYGLLKAAKHDGDFSIPLVKAGAHADGLNMASLGHVLETPSKGIASKNVYAVDGEASIPLSDLQPAPLKGHPWAWE